MGRKKTEVTKIVDMIAVTPKTKPSDKPIWGGKLERWWNDSTNGKQGIKKIGTNRNFAGKGEKADLSPSLIETLVGFQFKGFEFGNWLSQAERYDVFTAFQSCLIEMAKWLGTQNIGFDHQIGVAFGARGSRGASAHYEALTNMINMTKNYGAGALLHEYAHAIDYSIGAFVDQHIIFSALSGGHHTQQSPNNVGCQFRAMMNKILLYARSTESYKKMLSVPYYKMSISYWGNSTEMFARLTEAYFAYYYNPNHNHYLVKQTEIYEKQSKDYGVYLSKAEMDVIKPEVDKFWKEVASLLNNKCTLRKTPFPKVETESYYIAITFTIKEDWEWRGTKIEKDSHSLYFNREFKSKEDAVRELKKIKEELKKSKVVKKVTLSDNKLDADFLARTGQDTPLLSENITWEIKPGTLSKLDSKYAYDVHFPYWVLEAHKFTLTTDKFLSMAKKIGSEFEKKDAKEKSATSRVYFHKSGMENKASNYIAKHITPNSAKNLLSEIEKLAKKERLIPDRRQTRYGDTVYATVNGIELLFHDTLFSLNKSVKEDKKKEIKKVDEYTLISWEYTDETYKKVKEKLGPLKWLTNQPLEKLENILKNYEVNGKMAAWKTGPAGNEFISRTKYSIRYRVTTGIYFETFIVDSNGKRLNEPKADSSKKKVEKRPDKLNFDFGKFVKRDKSIVAHPQLVYTWEEYNYIVASDLFHLAYERFEDSLDDNFIKLYDKNNKLIYKGDRSENPLGTINYVNFKKVLDIHVKKRIKIDVKQLESSLKELKTITKENKAAYKKNDKDSEAFKKSNWLDRAGFVIGGVIFKPATIDKMIYVCKTWKLDTLLIEDATKGCMIKNEDGSKQALFMPVVYMDDKDLTPGTLNEQQNKMLKDKGYFVHIDFL